MNILIVSAHDDTKSFVAALHNTALGVLERAQHTVVVSDLYAQQFNPVASSLDFTTSSGTHANYMFEQQRAVNTGGGFSPDVDGEMKKVKDADIIIIHFPLWWGGPPAILKGWFDRVFAMGFAWNGDKHYENGLLSGKKVLVTVSAGDPGSFYTAEGMHGATVEQHLYGLTNGTLAFCGMDVYKPFVVTNVTAAEQAELEKRVEDYRDLLQSIDSYSSYIYKHA
jgi:NAD(P)H dehydrogenase (quinone)